MLLGAPPLPPNSAQKDMAMTERDAWRQQSKQNPHTHTRRPPYRPLDPGAFGARASKTRQDK